MLPVHRPCLFTVVYIHSEQDGDRAPGHGFKLHRIVHTGLFRFIGFSTAASAKPLVERWIPLNSWSDEDIRFRMPDDEDISARQGWHLWLSHLDLLQRKDMAIRLQHLVDR